MTIKENDFRKIDLNLLVAFAVLYREQSVSLAADKLHLGQPAVSGSLARLREMFDDPLFIRSGHRMQPTARADALHCELMPLLEQLQSTLFHPSDFNPATAKATITLGMADWVETWLMPVLLPLIRQQAPGIQLSVIASDPFTDQANLEGGEMDMVVNMAEGGPRWLESTPLLAMPFVALWHPQQVPLNGPLTQDDYLAWPHFAVSNREAGSSQVDTRLAKQGLARQISYTTPHFAALPGLLCSQPGIATVPAALAPLWQAHWGLSASPVPVAIPPAQLTLSWHQRHNSDPALMWLRDLVSNHLAEYSLKQAA
ncbi:LysR family transcriptional regulator [Mangrovibacter sp. MFB070]|uniref:LysR family transcriptional regulator n=1 Tax=Mangrovibacter sp. MFB070 TaxID=1224318 RepID=UPI0004D526F3|nr:LysR family transcriptional regulator [Mangrovibacter sp. MFB070]KEA50465.1 LysR family transcriptional regulator [Mangrovibacter sp. MFB070]